MFGPIVEKNGVNTSCLVRERSPQQLALLACYEAALDKPGELIEFSPPCRIGSLICEGRTRMSFVCPTGALAQWRYSLGLSQDAIDPKVRSAQKVEDGIWIEIVAQNENGRFLISWALLETDLEATEPIKRIFRVEQRKLYDLWRQVEREDRIIPSSPIELGLIRENGATKDSFLFPSGRLAHTQWGLGLPRSCTEPKIVEAEKTDEGIWVKFCAKNNGGEIQTSWVLFERNAETPKQIKLVYSPEQRELYDFWKQVEQEERVIPSSQIALGLIREDGATKCSFLFPSRRLAQRLVGLGLPTPCNEPKIVEAEKTDEGIWVKFCAKNNGGEIQTSWVLFERNAEALRQIKLKYSPEQKALYDFWYKIKEYGHADCTETPLKISTFVNSQAGCPYLGKSFVLPNGSMLRKPRGLGLGKNITQPVIILGARIGELYLVVIRAQHDHETIEGILIFNENDIDRAAIQNLQRTEICKGSCLDLHRLVPGQLSDRRWPSHSTHSEIEAQIYAASEALIPVVVLTLHDETKVIVKVGVDEQNGALLFYDPASDKQLAIDPTAVKAVTKNSQLKFRGRSIEEIEQLALCSFGKLDPADKALLRALFLKREKYSDFLATLPLDKTHPDTNGKARYNSSIPVLTPRQHQNLFSRLDQSRWLVTRALLSFTPFSRLHEVARQWVSLEDQPTEGHEEDESQENKGRLKDALSQFDGLLQVWGRLLPGEDFSAIIRRYIRENTQCTRMLISVAQSMLKDSAYVGPRELLKHHLDNLRGARDTAHVCNLRLARKVVSRFLKAHPAAKNNDHELVAAAEAALIPAIDRFDVGRNRFSSYAWPGIERACASIHNQLERVVRITPYAIRFAGELADTEHEVLRRYNRGSSPPSQTEIDLFMELNTPEIAAELGTKPEDIQQTRALRERYERSLDGSIGKTDESYGAAPTRIDNFTLKNLLAPDEETAQELLEREETVTLIRGLLEELSTRERLILERRFISGHTLEKVADELDVSIERVRQVEIRAKAKLHDKLLTKLGSDALKQFWE